MGARAKVEIDARPEQVFFVMTDPELSKQWLKGKVETIPVDGPLDRVGARFKQRFPQGNRWVEYDGQITAYEKGKLFAAEINNGPFVSHGRYEIERAGAGTLLHFSIEFHGRTLGGKLLCVFLGVMSKLMCRQQVTSLKKFVEERRDSLLV